MPHIPGSADTSGKETSDIRPPAELQTAPFLRYVPDTEVKGNAEAHGNFPGQWLCTGGAEAEPKKPPVRVQPLCPQNIFRFPEGILRTQDRNGQYRDSLPKDPRP